MNRIPMNSLEVLRILNSGRQFLEFNAGENNPAIWQYRQDFSFHVQLDAWAYIQQCSELR